MEQSLPKIMGGMVPVSIALVIFLRAFWAQRKAYQKYWVISLSCYWLRHVVVIYIPGRFNEQDYVAWFYGLLVMIAVYFLYRGTNAYLGRKQTLWPVWSILCGMALSGVFAFLNLSTPIVSFPPCFATGLCYLLSCIALTKGIQIKPTPVWLLISAFLLMFILQSFLTPLGLALFTHSRWHFFASGLSESFLVTSLIIFYFHTREQMLSLAKDQAAKAVEIRDRFLANMSHELRTPLHGILGVIDLAKQACGSQSQLRYLEMARDAATTLQDRVEELLDISSLESSQLQLSEEMFILRDLLDSVTSALAAPARQAGLQIYIWADRTVPDILVGDPKRLKQVLINLGANAIKFTPSGEVEVKVELDNTQSDKTSLLFSVDDTGIGISPEQTRKIFEPFHRIDNGLAAKRQGTGLGLAISNRLVQAMGGELKVESTPGNGSRFSFALEFATARAVSNKPPTGKKVLLAIPDSKLATATDHMLSSLGVNCSNLNCYQADQNLYINDLLIVDSNAPQDVLIYIKRQYKKAGTNTKLVVLHAPNGYNSSFFSMYPGKVDICLPLLHRDLASLFDGTKNMNIGTQNSEHTISSTQIYLRDNRTPRVLLAEDNLISQTIMRSLLETRGMEIDLAEDGVIACQLAKSEVYDFIFLDLRMPEKDGLSVATEIRTNPRSLNSQTPMAALTAQVYESDKLAAKKAGMEYFLSKPLDTMQLENILAAHFDVKFIDKGEFNYDWRKQVNILFLGTYGTELDEIERRLDDGDIKRVAALAHRFKSSLVFFSDPNCMEQATRLQVTAEAGLTSDSKEAFVKLRERVDSLVTKL